MKYTVQQEFKLFVSEFSIYDEDGKLVFLVKEQFKFFTKLFFVYDQHDHKIAEIHGNFIGFNYWFTKEGKDLAGLTRQIALDGSEFILNISQGPDYKIKGSFMETNYVITKKDSQIGKVHTEMFQILDRYEIDIDNSEDPFPILMAVIIIDRSKHGPKQ